MATNLPGKGIPIIGPWIGRIGQVADIMATPCDVDPEVWVYAFFNGVPRMLVSLFKPTPEDYITERFGKPHKRIRRSRFMVDDILEPIDPGKGIGWQAFKLFSWKERVGWWFCIVDAGVELSYYWSSMAYQWSGCATPGVAGARIAFALPQYAVNNGDFWGNWNVVASTLPVTADLGGINVPPNMQGAVQTSISVEPASFGTPKAKQIVISLVDTKTGTVSNQWDLKPKDGEPARLKDIDRNWLGLSGEQRWQIRQDFADGLYKVDASMEFYGSRDIGVTHDP